MLGVILVRPASSDPNDKARNRTVQANTRAHSVPLRINPVEVWNRVLMNPSTVLSRAAANMMTPTASTTPGTV